MELLKFFDLPSNRTVDNCAKTATVKTTGHERTHFTTALSCVADRAKLPLMIIFKKKQHPKRNSHLASVHLHSKGLMDENGMLLWLQKV